MRKIFEVLACLFKFLMLQALQLFLLVLPWDHGRSTRNWNQTWYKRRKEILNCCGVQLKNFLIYITIQEDHIITQYLFQEKLSYELLLLMLHCFLYIFSPSLLTFTGWSPSLHNFSLILIFASEIEFYKRVLEIWR